MKALLLLAGLGLGACSQGLQPLAPSEGTEPARCEQSATDSTWRQVCQKGDTTIISTTWSQAYGERHPEFAHGNGGGGERVRMIGADTILVESW